MKLKIKNQEYLWIWQKNYCQILLVSQKNGSNLLTSKFQQVTKVRAGGKP